MAEGDLINAGCCLAFHVGWAGSGGSVVRGPSWGYNRAGPGCQGNRGKAREVLLACRGVGVEAAPGQEFVAGAV